MSDKKDKKQPIVALDPVALKELRKVEDEQNAQESSSAQQPQDTGVLGMILKSLKSHNESQVQRMAFEVNPQANLSGGGAGFYRLKTALTPDFIIKRVSGPQGDELVCQILQARSNHLASFGRPRTDRFSNGFDFQDMDRNAIRSEEETAALQEKVDKLRKFFWKCGTGRLDEELDDNNLSQFLKMITRDGIAFGRFAVEFLWTADPQTGKKKLYAFRPVDAGTIYKILPQKEQDQSLRAEAVRMLSQLKDEKISIEKYKKDEYRWVQVIEGKPVQAFTENELVVYNLYPVTNVEYNGYPLTPIDQALNAITTHINITMHNRLYFQNGRAARGMLVFKSDSIDESTVQKIRLQFHQSINSAQNSWRMPVFAVGPEDDVSWQSIDTSGRDAEFQYLMDNNARVILSAFQMSPEELPGYAHLARGTNTQALSESDNEWKLTAARDVGLRPLLYDIQDFFNTHVLPKIDEEFAKTHQLILTGLDKDSPEKEATRLGQDMPIHMTYNEVMTQVEKNEIPKELGGEFPLNPQFQQVVQSYLTVGEILENFFGRKGAAQDPRYQWIQNPLWLQYQQILMQKAQMAMQQQQMMEQQMQQQAMQQQQIAAGIDPNAQQEGESEEGGDQDGPPQDTQKSEFVDYQTLAKATSNNHNELTKMILKRHKELVARHLDQWKQDSKKSLEAIKKKLDEE